MKQPSACTRLSSANINNIAVFCYLQLRKMRLEGHSCTHSRMNRHYIPFAVSFNLLNVHQVITSNTPPVHTEVIKLNMINGRMLKQLNLKMQLSNWR